MTRIKERILYIFLNTITYTISLPIMRNGAARLMPMKSIPRYMHNPKAATVATAAEILPRRPSQGLLRTQSVIMQVTTEKRPIMMNVLAKYGTTVFVLASSSSSRVLDANLAMLICLNTPASSTLPTTSRNASSHAAPLIQQSK